MGNFKSEIHLLKNRSDLAILRLQGSLDSFSVGDLETTLKEMIRDRRYHLILNCQGLKFISSSGMGLLLGILGDVEKHGGSIRLVQVNDPEIKDAMNLLGLLDIFPVSDQESDALQKIDSK